MFMIRTIIGVHIVLGLFILPSILAANQTILEVIHLKHRTTDEIIPLIQPFLDEQGALNGMRGRLIIRTTPDNLQEIKQLLNEIDLAPRRLILTVKQNVDRATARSLLKLSGNVGTKEMQIKIPGSSATRKRGLIIDNKYGDNRAKIQALNRQKLENDRNTQYVQVLDGGYASIHMGESLPLPIRNTIDTPQGTQVIESVQYRDATTGFIVVPRVNGKQVTLEISPQRNSPNRQFPGAVNIQQIVTSVSGRLGEWIDLGGLEKYKFSQTSSPNTPHSGMITNEQRTVLIKVEETN